MKVIFPATREQAYVYAISSAALTHTMARACSGGALHHCTCAGKPTSAPPDDQFQWGGCGDNVEWGQQFAKRFVDNAEKYSLDRGEDKQKKEEEGEVITESLHTQCKCHGVSGSCNIKTCWRALPSMTEIGYKLLKKYTTALELHKDEAGRTLSEGISKRRRNRAANWDSPHLHCS
ncbi:unnamed protein product [Phaedon cochleariae]|uniref:Protein Wnt n=1 Tax=Phaedon cochleariae TaxID=80249 RepID=A0A9N9X870_PHACE|nr:unnamed protein product [Phaedon cochleariae]